MKKNAIYAGIDAGSRAIKVALIDSERRVIASGLTEQGVDQSKLALRMFESLLKGKGIARTNVKRVVATGYGRDAVDFADMTITEITCQACGVRFAAPDARTVVDIGGQDSKLLRLDPDGKVRDFVMNDRCAAGTGRFLEIVSARLGIKPEGIGRLILRSRKEVSISSMCAVFAETEIVGLLAAGEKPANIIAGVQAAIAARIAAMAGRNTVEPVIFTGGVALIRGMDRALERSLGHPVKIAHNPQLTCALGAALLAQNAPHSMF